MAHSHHCVKPELWLNATMQDRKPQDQDKFVIRLPAGMRERIKASADANNRSMNAEIVSRLDDSLEERQHVASLSLNIDLSEIDAADLKEKLSLLSEHLKEFKLKAPQPVQEQDSDDGRL